MENKDYDQLQYSVKDDTIYAFDRWFDGLDYSNVFSKVKIH